MRLNDLGQPIGDPVAWSGARHPEGTVLEGRLVSLEPLTAQHAPALLDLGRHRELWTYLGDDAPTTFDEALAKTGPRNGWITYAIIDRATGRFLGRAGYLRIQPRVGSIEVGGIVYDPELQRTRASTEVQYLLARHVFEDLGYRRYEWRCDDLNAPSHRAAERLGFVDEGTFRNGLVNKGHSRDTVWFSITDLEWPRIAVALRAWLDDANADAHGRQRQTFGGASCGRVSHGGRGGAARHTRPHGAPSSEAGHRDERPRPTRRPQRGLARCPYPDRRPAPGAIRAPGATALRPCPGAARVGSRAGGVDLPR